MPPIADGASKRHQSSIGRQFISQAAAPPQVALETAVVIPVVIERNCQVIVAGRRPLYRDWLALNTIKRAARVHFPPEFRQKSARIP